MERQEGSSPPSPMEGFPEEEKGTANTAFDAVDFPMAQSTTPAMSDPREPEHRKQLSVPFFADATLDLSEAHDIAETPEPQRKTMDHPDDAHPILELPSLETDTITETGSRNTKIQPPTENMARITSADVPRSLSHRPTASAHRPRAPRRPRDVPWAVAWLLLVPTSLIWTCTVPSVESAAPLDSQVALCVFYALVLAYGATVLLGRFLYRTMGGGDGDDARHVASQILLAFCPLAVAVYPLLTLVVYWKVPGVFWKYAWIPMAAGVREGYWAIQNFRSRQTFFAALMCMALDILSRSLRRLSFARSVGLLLGVQLAMVVWWKLAVFGAWNSGRMLPLVVALIAGKWMTATVTRLLSLVAAGGVASWFAQQNLLMEEMESMRDTSQQEQVDSSRCGGASGESVSDDASADYNVTEEYRSAAATAYQSVLEFDEGLDDDDIVEEDRAGQNTRPTGDWTGSASSVKGFLIYGLTISFGSVAQCALVGGIAQFLWTILRNVDGLSSTISGRFPSSSSQLGFQGMQIGSVDGTGLIGKLLQYANVSARSFVRGHSDLAMSHVAAYYKSYQRAASDVSALVDASGVEPIIHDDISTHLCGCICATIAGLITAFVGIILAHHRSQKTTDDFFLQSMILSFFFCYTMIFTIMEPLRAAIKAVYVSFAQHPHSLSQAFPLIFHRLSRVSEANLA